MAARHAKACQHLIWGAKYPLGYLRDFPYMIVPKFDSNPAELTIRVWWATEDFSFNQLPREWREKIQELEQRISEISKSILGFQIPQSVENNGVGKSPLPSDVPARNKDLAKSG